MSSVSVLFLLKTYKNGAQVAIAGKKKCEKQSKQRKTKEIARPLHWRRFQQFLFRVDSIQSFGNPMTIVNRFCFDANANKWIEIGTGIKMSKRREQCRNSMKKKSKFEIVKKNNVYV